MALHHLGRLLYNRAMPHATKSALQDAREAFIAGLARRADALRPVVDSFIADPAARVVRAELQRRLHSLLTSAQLFEEPSLVAQLQQLTSRLDAVGLDTEAWQAADSELLLSLLASLDPQDARTQVSGVAPAPLPANEPFVRRASEPPLRSAHQVANETSFPPPAQAARPANRPPAPPVPTHQVGAVMLTRVLLVCSRPHAAELRSMLDEAPIELLHAADPEQALALLERCSPSHALIAAEFATLPDIDLVGRLRHDPQHAIDHVYLMLPQGATYDVEFVRQTGADGVLIEPISWEMLGPLLDRGAPQPPLEQPPAEAPPLDPEERTEPSEKLSLDGGLSAAFAQAQSAADEAQRHVIESARVPKARPPVVPQTSSVLARVQAIADQLAPAAPQLQAAPAARAEPAAVGGTPTASAPEAARARSLIGRRILIVDDDPAMLWFFSGVVREAGGEAMQARDGAEGLDLARRKRPQLVLSDILMPKLDGFALRRSLGRDLYMERTPVLLLSWKGDPVEDTEARPTNASGLLRKEASVPEVLAAIERALAPRQRIEQALRAEGDVTGQVDDLGIVTLIECVVAARPDVRLTVEDAADLFEISIADANQISVTRTAADGTFTRGERALLQLIGLTHGRFHVSKRIGSLRGPVQTPLKPALHAAVSEITALIDALSSDRIAQVSRVLFDEDALSARLQDSANQPIVSELRAHGLSPAQLLNDGKISSGELAACLIPLARHAVVTALWDADGKDLLSDITRLQMPRPALPPTLPDATTAGAPTPQPQAASSAPAAPEPTSTEPEPAATAPDPVVAPPAESPRLQEVAPPAVAREEAPALREAPPPPEEPAVEAKAAEPDSDFDPDPEADFQLHTNPVLIAEIAAARRRGREGVLLIATLAASAVLGYIGALQLETHPALFGSGAEAVGARGLDQPLMAATPTSETSVRSGLDASYGLGTVLPYIDTTRGVPVGNDEGLVIFEYVGPLPTPNVEIDGRVLGSPPLSVALAATPHQLKLWFAGQPTTRTLSVRAGETRVITLPLSKP